MVVAEGDDEARSVGSFSVRLYDAAAAPDATTFFSSELVRARDGVIESIKLADTGGDAQPEIVVVVRSVGTGGYLSAQSFAVANNTLNFQTEVGGLAADAEPVAALRPAAQGRM